MPSRIANSLLWIFDVFEDEPTYLRKRMFGCEAAYLDGLLCLVVADGEAPWNGLMVCTSREFQPSLIEALPALRAHEVLGKWLFVPEDDADFEDTVAAITLLVRKRDPRIGVAPSPRKRKGASKASVLPK